MWMSLQNQHVLFNFEIDLEVKFATDRVKILHLYDRIFQSANYFLTWAINYNLNGYFVWKQKNISS